MDRKIEDLGYDAFFESGRKEAGLDVFSVARVIVEHRGVYKVLNEKGEFLAKVTGKQMFRASSREDYPAVGDWVAIVELGSDMAVIQGVLPRKTVILRKHGDRSRVRGRTEVQVIGANIDVAFIVESIDRDYNLNRFERYFALVKDGGVKPAIILNKADLISDEELESRVNELKRRFRDIDIVSTSTVGGQGLNELRAYIQKGKTYCFLGSSGVGKSSLINRLIGKDIIDTGGISLYSGRGKHVTTRREMYFLKNGGIVIDNPGMREVGMADAGTGIESLFEEMSALGENCEYADCTHIHEPGCAVLEALGSGKLDRDKYDNYITLRKEADFYELSEREKRNKERSFGRFVKSAKKGMRRYE